jgi:cytochrome c-type biogenesis protein
VWDTRAIGTVPLSIAFAAGGLAVVNPCGFPLLPAFLAFYLGADEQRLPPAPTRIAQGLVVGGLVALGFLGCFTAVGLPVSFGLGAVADAVPWLGLGTGVALVLTGVAVLAGRHVRLPIAVRVRVRRRRGVWAMLVFGVAYGAASLGCTLPIFLALVGASVGADKLSVFGAYGAGMAIVLMALAVSVAFARQGVAHRLRPALPYVGALSGALLLVSGGYLSYYWARIRFGDRVTLANDPIVGFAARYSAQLHSFAERHGTPLLAVAGLLVALALASGVRHRRRRGATTAGLARQ